MNGQSMSYVSPSCGDSGFIMAMNCMNFVVAAGDYQLRNCCGSAAASQLPQQQNGAPVQRPPIPDMATRVQMIQQSIPQQPWFGFVRQMMPAELQYRLPIMYA